MTSLHTRICIRYIHITIYIANITNDFRRSRNNAITLLGIPEMLQWEIKFLTNLITSRCVHRCRKFVARKERDVTCLHALLFSLSKKRGKVKRKGKKEKEKEENTLNENEQFATSAEAPSNVPP